MDNPLAASGRNAALALGALALGGLARAQTAKPNFTPVPANAPAAAEINAFLKADESRMPPEGAVLFIGSSSIRMWTTLARDFPEIPVINRGFGGSLVRESTLYADRIVVPYRPKIVVLFAGTNDLAYGNRDPQGVLHDFEAFVAKVHAALPDARIVYISISPTVARWKQEAEVLETNHLIQDFILKTGSTTEKLSFVDTHSQLLTADGQPQPALERADGLHFNDEGYKVFASIVRPRILALAAVDGVRRLPSPR